MAKYWKSVPLAGGVAFVALVGLDSTAFAQTGTPAGSVQGSNADPAPASVAEASAGATPETAAGSVGAVDNRAGIGDIVVTARRREESLQKVPVSVSAFSGQALVAAGVQSTLDLQRLVPGVVFNGGGTAANTSFSIRGQGKDVIGAGLPSVISYFNEVPLPSFGAILPTFDVANIQVLKGPQGTLFGRNTTGGAVLVYSEKPSYDVTGYVQGTAGAYSWNALQGAINIPIVDQKIALRVAGDYVRRDGYTKNLSGFKDQDNLNSRAFRASLLIEPVDGVSNVTVYDYLRSRTNYNGTVVVGATGTPIYRFGAAAFGPIAGPLINAAFNCTTSISCNVDQQIARQRATGPRTTYSDFQPFDRTSIWGVSNTTTINLGSVTLKNIFGYRQTNVHQNGNTDGLEVALLNSRLEHNDRQLTDEVQVSGGLLNNRLTYLVGAFYLNTKPNGFNGLALDLFRPAFIPASTPFIGTVSNNLYSDRSKAVFASGTFEILEGLKLNGGVRKTWDRQSVCNQVTQPFTAAFLSSLSQCQGLAGSFNGSAKFSAYTWSGGLDYQITSDIFTYGVVRRGYRSGGLNAPQLGGTLVPYQSYGPQTVTDVELGIKVNWRARDVRGRFNIAAFRGNYRNLQRLIAGFPPDFDGDGNTNDDPSNTSLNINSGKARVQGIEIDGVIAPTRNLTFSYGGSYLDSKYTDFSVPALFASLSGGTPVFQNSPKFSYSAAGHWTLPFELSGAKFQINGDYYWVDHYITGIFRTPSYSIANVNLQISNIGHKPISLTVFVDNVFDKVYVQNTSLSGSSPGVFSVGYGAPRMYGVRARYNF